MPAHSVNKKKSVIKVIVIAQRHFVLILTVRFQRFVDNYYGIIEFLTS